MPAAKTRRKPASLDTAALAGELGMDEAGLAFIGTMA